MCLIWNIKINLMYSVKCKLVYDCMYILLLKIGKWNYDFSMPSGVVIDSLTPALFLTEWVSQSDTVYHLHTCEEY